MTVIVSTNFDSDTTGALPSGWTNRVGTWQVLTDNPVSGAKAMRSTGAANGDVVHYTGSTTADHQADTKHKAVLTSGKYPMIGHVFRSDSANANLYLIAIFDWDGSTAGVFLYKKVAGSFTLIGSTSITLSVSNGDTIYFRTKAVGSAISCRVGNGSIPGSDTASWTDSSITAAGYFGFYTALSGVSPIAISVDDLVLDDTTAGGTAPNITTTSLPGASVGSAYSQTLAATGTTPITWSVASGSLPTGLSLNTSSGAITGTPTTAGTYSFTIGAANGTSPDDTQALSVIVSEAFVATPTDNILLCWPNRIDEATLSGGSWPTLTLANMQTPDELWKVCRSANALTTSTKINIDLTTSRSIRMVALCNHNISSAATWRIKGGTSAGASDVYDSGSQGCWAMTFDSEMLEWEENNWWDGIADDQYIRHPWDIVWPFDTYYNARYWTIEITDTTNPDGYVQMGRIFIGGGLQPQINPFYGLADKWVDPTGVEVGVAGTEFFDRQTRYKQVEFELGMVELEDEKRLYEMRRRLGVAGEVYYIPNPSDLAECQRKGFLGRQIELAEHRYLSPELRAARVALRQRV